MNAFLQAYITCALWISNDESTPSGGEQMDKNYSLEDIATECLAQMSLDCKTFQETNKELLEQSGLDDARAGHCFWLNRNGHGSGFWDEYSVSSCNEYVKGAVAFPFVTIKKEKDLDNNCPCPYHVCQRLSKASKAFGEFNLYVGNNKKIYGSK
jgi:hypothetical protein